MMRRLMAKLISTKYRTRLGTWNVRKLYQTGWCAQVAAEMNRYNIEVLGLCKVRWNTFGKVTLSTGQVLLCLGKENEEHPREAGVGIMLSKKASKSLIEWELISDRIIKARLESRHQKTTIIQCYSPTNDATEEAKTSFYEELRSLEDRVPRRDVLLLMGELNAKVGADNAGRGEAMGQHGIEQMNENGELQADFCINCLVIGSTLLPHKQLHKSTWVYPDGCTTNQIDHIAISCHWRSSFLDVRAKRGADVASDHHLVIGEVKIKLSTRRQPRPTRVQQTMFRTRT